MEGSQEVTEQIIYNSVLWWERCLNFWIDGFCTSQSHGFRERIIYIQKLWSHSWDLPVPTISLPSTTPVWPISFSSTAGAPEIASGMCWIAQRKWCIAVSEDHIDPSYFSQHSMITPGSCSSEAMFASLCWTEAFCLLRVLHKTPQG